MLDLLINLLASVIAGSAVWAAQWLFRHRVMSRKRRFFGVEPGHEVLLYVAKHASSPRENSVHRNDVASLIELAAVIKECGGTPSLLSADENRPQSGRVTEYCVGGPMVNPRTDAHMRAEFPGIVIEPFQAGDLHLAFSIGGTVFRRDPAREEFVVLARSYAPSRQHPVFLLIGQTARSNVAAARMLVERYVELSRDHPEHSAFCLLLRIKEPTVFGPDRVEIVRDFTAEALVPPPPRHDEAAETAEAVLPPPRAEVDEAV